ncbi:31696_t:CDS:2, partial [Racocetra persica]
PILKYCSSCYFNKSTDLFETNKKSCLLCLNRLNEGYKRKREEQYVDDIYDMQEKAIEPEEVEDIVYQESMDVEEGGQQISVSNEVKKYIQANLSFFASELYRQITKEKMDGYELLTVKQVYYWWTQYIITKYKCVDNQIELAKLFLREKNYEIILEFDNP